MHSLKPSTHRPSKLPTMLLAMLASACAVLLSAGEAQARERSTVVTGPKGQTVQRNVARHQGDVNATTTGPNGKFVTRNVDRSSAGTTATVTGSGGKTVSRVVTRQP